MMDIDNIIDGLSDLDDFFTEAYAEVEMADIVTLEDLEDLLLEGKGKIERLLREIDDEREIDNERGE